MNCGTGPGTRISISDGRTELKACLNDTAAARDFLKRLPCRLNVSDSGEDYRCGTASGVFDPLETASRLEAGDISIGEGIFSMRYKGTESRGFSGVTVIGKLDRESIDRAAELPERPVLTIKIDNGNESKKR
ncbi:MAG: cyclophilin-like fold protein [Oscillospiraceae bacterium]